MKKNDIRAKNKGDVEIISHEVAFKGYFSIEKLVLKHRLHEGGWSGAMTREVFERGQVAAVLPYDPERKKVVLAEQFRVGALNDEKSPWMIEIVAGVLEPGETPEQLVHREAKEEANIQLGQLIPICHYWVSPGGCTERVKLFCGKVDSSKANGIHGLGHENEDIRVLVYDQEEAFEMVRNGTINNALGIIALQWLELNWKKIRRGLRE